MVLPFSAVLWYRSQAQTEYQRSDVTPYKSLAIYLHDGVCSLQLLSMADKTNIPSKGARELSYDPRPQKKSFYFYSKKNEPGNYRVTWIGFPLWLTTITLALLAAVPLLFSPVRDLRRKRKGWCVTCGYDLFASKSNRCSECGQSFHRRDVAAAHRRRRGQ